MIGRLSPVARNDHVPGSGALIVATSRFGVVTNRAALDVGPSWTPCGSNRSSEALVVLRTIATLRSVVSGATSIARTAVSPDWSAMSRTSSPSMSSTPWANMLIPSRVPVSSQRPDALSTIEDRKLRASAVAEGSITALIRQPSEMNNSANPTIRSRFWAVPSCIRPVIKMISEPAGALSPER